MHDERIRHKRQFRLAGLMAFVGFVALICAFAFAFHPAIVIALDIAAALLVIANGLRLDRIRGWAVPRFTFPEWAIVILVCVILTGLLRIDVDAVMRRYEFHRGTTC